MDLIERRKKLLRVLTPEQLRVYHQLSNEATHAMWVNYPLATTLTDGLELIQELALRVEELQSCEDE